MDPKDQKSKVDAYIDNNLRRLFDSKLETGVPDRFTELLNRLEAGEYAGEPDAADDATAVDDARGDVDT